MHLSLVYLKERVDRMDLTLLMFLQEPERKLGGKRARKLKIKSVKRCVIEFNKRCMRKNGFCAELMIG